MNTPQNFTGNFQREQGVLLVISISNAQLLCVLAKNLSHLSSRIQTSNKAPGNGLGWRLSPHMKKSHMSIQKMPASAPMTCSLSRSCGVHRVSLSDHLPFHEYLPHGLRRRINLRRMSVTLKLLKLQAQVHRQEISRTTKIRHFTSPSFCLSNFLLSNFFFLYQDSLQLISLNLRTTHVKLYPQNKASSQILP